MTEQFLINGTDIKEDPKVLCIAVEYGNLKIVEDLLKSGADPNVIDKSMLFRGQRPLHIAVRLNHVEIAKLLIKYGADVNVKDREGETPIIFAIQKNNTEMIQLLLTKGADIKDPKVLCIAVENGNLKIVEDLLKNGADANMIYNLNTGETLLHSAVCWREIVTAKLLIKYGADINVKGKARATPIVYAIRTGNTEIFGLLLTNGADIKDPKVLCIAVEYGNLKIVEDLLKNGADPNVIGKSRLFRGQGPLHIAVRRNQVEIAKLLIKYGADVNVKDREGETPIIFAIQKNNTEMIQLLLTKGADIKDPNVLCIAVENGNLKIVEDLLKNGADANMIYNLNTGDTLVDSAVCWREFVSAKLMMKYRCYVDTRYNVIGNLNWFRGLTLLHIAVVGNQVAMVKLLIKYGADINVKGKARATPIVYAIRAENTEIFGLLLTNGADIKDPKVLCIAVEYGNLKIVEDLLKNGADPNVIGKSMLFRGQRPLHIAVRWNQVEFAKLLIKYGADVNVKDKAGETPIIYAIQKNNTKMIELLLTSGADTKDVNTNLLRVDSPTTKILKQHIAKVKAAGLYVSERNLLWISNDYEINNFVNECEAEIQIMKSKKIDNSCASFYDILTKNKSELAKNESIVQALKSDGYKTKFPIYATMIDSRFRRWLEREKLLEQFRKKFLHSLFESLPELPFLCTEKIFNYLSDLDLRMLLVA